MLAERLTGFVIETRTADVPPTVINGARDALADTVGVALAGSLAAGVFGCVCGSPLLRAQGRKMKAALGTTAQQ